MEVFYGREVEDLEFVEFGFFVENLFRVFVSMELEYDWWVVKFLVCIGKFC